MTLRTRFLFDYGVIMDWSIGFFITSAMLGVGLAMDAFSVSLANGLHEPKMRAGRMMMIAGIFAGFQAFMPLAGWFAVHTFLEYFKAFEKFIPWIALGLLAFIGGKNAHRRDPRMRRGRRRLRMRHRLRSASGTGRCHLH